MAGKEKEQSESLAKEISIFISVIPNIRSVLSK